MKNVECDRKSGKSGFSLIEVMIAMCVASVGCLTIIGLLPVGLTTLHNSIDSSTNNEIVQQVSGELQQADFTAVTTQTSSLFSTPFYFDGNAKLMTADGPSRVYAATVTVAPATSLPGGNGTYNSNNLASVQVQISTQPYGSSNSPSKTQGKIYSFLIARN